MPGKEKHHVFSARTTEKGLKILNDLKGRLGMSWDELIVDAVCAHYGLERSALALPKAEKPEVEVKAKAKARSKPKAKAKVKPAAKVKAEKKEVKSVAPMELPDEAPQEEPAGTVD